MASRQHPSENRQSGAGKPSKQQIREARREDRDEQEELDVALRDSFPASDPVAISQPTTATPSLTDKPIARAGDRTRRKLHDRINVADKAELDYWTGHFGVSETKLKEAVKNVGFFPQDVAHYLDKPL
jgi:hypothetical protein